MKKLLGLFLGLILSLNLLSQSNTSDNVVVTFNGSNGGSVNQTFTDTTKFGLIKVLKANVGSVNDTVFLLPSLFYTTDGNWYNSNTINDTNIMNVLDNCTAKFDIIDSIGTDLETINITLSNLTINNSYMTFYDMGTDNSYRILMVQDTTHISYIDNGNSDTLFISNPDTLQGTINNYDSGIADISIDIPNPDATVGDHSIILFVEPIVSTSYNYLRYGLIRINYTVVSGNVGSAVGLNENVIVESKFEVYPNPVNDVLNVKTDIYNTNTLKYIYSLTGELIMTFKGSSIDLSGLTNGMYILTDGKNTCKFVKQ